MRSSKSKEVPLPNPRNSQSKDTVQDITTSWDALSQTKAAMVDTWMILGLMLQSPNPLNHEKRNLVVLSGPPPWRVM
uniref:Centrosomal protein 350 n=1 Tax=Homo sapiens TaxID=9606 RepID=H0Y7F7_HUMAN